LPDQNSTFDVGQKCVIAGWGLLKAYGRGPKVSLVLSFLDDHSL